MCGSLIAAGGALAGGIISGRSSSKAADASAAAALEAARVQEEANDAARADLRPAVQAGDTARNVLAFETGVSRGVPTVQRPLSPERQAELDRLYSVLETDPDPAVRELARGKIARIEELAAVPYEGIRTSVEAREAPRRLAAAQERAFNVGIDANRDAEAMFLGGVDDRIRGAQVARDFAIRGQQENANALRLGMDDRIAGAQAAGNIFDAELEAATGVYNPIINRGETAGQAYGFNLGLNDAPEGYAGFTETPYYDFVRDEGIGAVESSMAARGLSNSGRAMKELARFGSGLASTEFNNYMSRLGQLQGSGQDAANSLTSFRGVNADRRAGVETAIGDLRGSQDDIAGGAALNTRNIQAQNSLDVTGLQAVANALRGQGVLDRGALEGQGILALGEGEANSLANVYADENRQLDRVQNLAGAGTTTSTNLAGIGTSTAANRGNALMAAGDARGAGYIGVANAFNQGLGGLIGAAGMMNAGAGPSMPSGTMGAGPPLSFGRPNSYTNVLRFAQWPSTR